MSIALYTSKFDDLSIEDFINLVIVLLKSKGLHLINKYFDFWDAFIWYILYDYAIGIW